ncbi:hypothetical protein AAC387_Pa06g3247 [Persea americana]
MDLRSPSVIGPRNGTGRWAGEDKWEVAGLEPTKRGLVLGWSKVGESGGECDPGGFGFGKCRGRCWRMGGIA